MDTLKDILDGETDQATTAPEAPTTDAASAPGQPRDEQGRFITPGEPAAAAEPVAAPDTPPVSNESGAAPATPASEPEPAHVPTAALTDERRKRQAAEARNQELERQLAAFQQSQQPVQQPAQPQVQAPALPDMFEDPEGYTRAIQAQMQQQVVATRLDMSETIARQSHPDFDEKMQAFQQAVQRRPDLIDQMMSDPHPAGFAYKVGSDFLELGQLGNLDGLKAKIRAEIEAELRAQAPAAPATPAPAAPAAPVIPTSLADAPSARAPGFAGAPDAGPPSLSQILDR